MAIHVKKCRQKQKFVANSWQFMLNEHELATKKPACTKWLCRQDK